MPEPPRLLVLDEPFDGLDQPTRINMTRFLADLMAAGIQLVMATHRGDELPPGIAHHLVVDGGRAAVAGGMVAGPRDEAPRRSGTAELPAPSATAPQAPPVLVELRQATVGYGPRRILDRLTWRHRRGEHWAILGPNGAGKTTLLRLIAGDHPQVYANDVRLMGKRRGSGETRHQVRADIAMTGPELQMAYQRPLAVRDVVLSGLFDSLGLFRRASSTQLDRAGAWLAAMGLERMAQADFRHLSGGQQRLALMARAMIKDPLLLILDEPCEGLDAQNRRRVLDCLDALAAQGRTHLLYVSHHPEDLPACISHVLHLAPGGAARQQARQKGGGEDGR
jgi:molybdate transport system ATP-binding protein